MKNLLDLFEYIAQRFIGALKNKIYKYMTSISKNVYINKLDDIVKKYYITYNRTIKMKPVDVKPSKYIDFNKEDIKKGPKLKVGDHVRISKYKDIFYKSLCSKLVSESFCD